MSWADFVQSMSNRPWRHGKSTVTV